MERSIAKKRVKNKRGEDGWKIMEIGMNEGWGGGQILNTVEKFKCLGIQVCEKMGQFQKM